MKSKSIALLLRYTLQGISLVVFIVLLVSLSYPPGRESLLLTWVSRLDPWLLLSQLRWQQEVPAWLWLPLLTLAATLLWGRVFCGWLCPFGAFLMLIDKLGRTVFAGLSLSKTRLLPRVEPVRVYWLIFLLIVFVLGSNWVLFLSPFTLFSHEVVGVLRGEFPWILLAITVGTLICSRAWCSMLCPTGVLLSFIARLRLFRYTLAGDCVRCEECARICSIGAAPVNSGIAEAGCLNCGDCQRICPTAAIKWQRRIWLGEKRKAVDEAAAVRLRQSRRRFFKTAFAIVMAAAFWEKTAWTAEKVLRPPGALPEPEFTAICNRCGRCIRICPGNALRPMPFDTGIANFATPYIIPRQNRCDLCLSCQQVCATGAIAQVPLEKVRMGKAIIEKSRCIAWTEAKACLICGEQCPVQAIQADNNHRPAVNYAKCVGCGSCENACPVDGDAAIRVIPG